MRGTIDFECVRVCVYIVIGYFNKTFVCLLRCPGHKINIILAKESNLVLPTVRIEVCYFSLFLIRFLHHPPIPSKLFLPPSLGLESSSFFLHSSNKLFLHPQSTVVGWQVEHIIMNQDIVYRLSVVPYQYHTSQEYN